MSLVTFAVAFTPSEELSLHCPELPVHRRPAPERLRSSSGATETTAELLRPGRPAKTPDQFLQSVKGYDGVVFYSGRNESVAS
jgi:hypothetical protein